MDGLVEERRLLEGWIKRGMDGRISRGKKTPVRKIIIIIMETCVLFHAKSHHKCRTIKTGQQICLHASCEPIKACTNPKNAALLIN
jgi:hypothetical protein